MDDPPPVMLVKVWSILNLYFLNYGLLEHVIRIFGSETSDPGLCGQTFCIQKNYTRLCDFIDSWPCKDDRPPEEELRKVVMNMRQEWTQCTLHDVESFKTGLVQKFFLQEF